MRNKLVLKKNSGCIMYGPHSIACAGSYDLSRACSEPPMSATYHVPWIVLRTSPVCLGDLPYELFDWAKWVWES